MNGKAYYCPARFWQAIRRPPKLGIDIKADEIKKAIHEVASESIALLIQDHAREKEVRNSRYPTDFYKLKAKLFQESEIKRGKTTAPVSQMCSAAAWNSVMLAR